MKKILFYLFWYAACVLMVIGSTYEEFQFAAIMCGIFAIINKEED